MSPRRPPAGTAATVAWVALLLVLAVPVWWGAHQPYSWDADNIAPGSVLRALAERFGPGWYSSYGPVPYQLTALVYAPLLAGLRLAGELGTPASEFPWGFAHPDASMAALIVAARLLTLALAVAAAALLARDHRAAGGTRGWIVPLLLVGSPVFAYYARTSNVDMHYAFWLVLAFAFAERRAPTAGRLAAGAAAAALAVCSKEQAAPFAAVAAGWALWRAARGDAGPARLRNGVAVGAAALAAYAAAWMLPFNLEGWRAHHHFVFHVAKYERTYALDAAGLGALAARLAELQPVTMGWPVLAGLGLALLARPRLAGLGPRTLGGVLYLAGFIGPVGYVYPRFLLPVTLLLAVPVAARGVEAVLARGGGRRAAGFAASALAVLALTGGPNLSLVQLTDTRLAVGAWLEARVPAGATVEVGGNPRFQARVPRRARLLLTSPDSIRLAPRGPRGDVVLLSSLDGRYFEADPTARSAWLDSLEAPDGAWHGPRVFRPWRPTGNILHLLVSPTVRAWVRRDLPEP